MREGEAIGGSKLIEMNSLKINIYVNFGLFHDQRFLRNRKIRIFREMAAISKSEVVPYFGHFGPKMG